MIELIVLDLDGTLVQLPIDWNLVERRIAELSKGRARYFLEFVSMYFGSDEFWQLHRFLEELELKALNNIRIFPDVCEFLENVKDRFRLAIVTMQSSAVARRIVDMLGIRPITIVSREDARDRIAQLSLVLDRLRIDRGRAVFVGDKVLDMVAAYVNRVRGFMVVRQGFNPWVSPSDNIEEDLRVLGATVVRSLIEVMSYLG